MYRILLASGYSDEPQVLARQSPLELAQSTAECYMSEGFRAEVKRLREEAVKKMQAVPDTEEAQPKLKQAIIEFDRIDLFYRKISGGVVSIEEIPSEELRA